MRFALLIARDAVRSVRRHRLFLAFLLVWFAGLGLVTTGIRGAAKHVAHVEHAQGQAAAGAPEPDAARIDAKVRMIQAGFQGFFVFAMSQLGCLLALLVFCTAVAAEVSSGTIRVTLAKPIPRWAYLLGKWLGAAAVVGVYAIIGGVAAAIIGHAYGVQSIATSLSIPWLTFCGSVVTGTVGLVYSLFMRAPVAGVLAWFTSASWVHGIPILYEVLPSYAAFDVWGRAVLGTQIGPWHLVLATLYAADLVIILLLIGFARFRRMEIA